MTKNKFMENVRSGISSLPENDIKRWLDYYAEMIDDRIEDGMSEEDAVLAMGSVDEVVSQILRDESNESKAKKEKTLLTTIKEYINQYVTDENRFWIILVLVLAIPIWVPVVSALFGAAVSVVATVFSGVIGLYAGSFALAVAFAGCLAKGIAILSMGGVIADAILYFGIGFICIGFAILLFLAAYFLAKLIIKGIKYIYSYVKSKLQVKEERI